MNWPNGFLTLLMSSASASNKRRDDVDNNADVYGDRDWDLMFLWTYFFHFLVLCVHYPIPTILSSTALEVPPSKVLSKKNRLSAFASGIWRYVLHFQFRMRHIITIIYFDFIIIFLSFLLFLHLNCSYPFNIIRLKSDLLVQLLGGRIRRMKSF